VSSNAPSHEHIEDLIAASVLDGLDEDERGELQREMATHGPDCSECARLMTEYSETAGRMAFAVDALPLSPGAEDRLIEAARDWDRSVGEGSAAVLTEAPRRRRGRARPPGIRVKVWLVAAAAAVIAVVAGLLGYALAPTGSNLQAVTLTATGGQHLSVVYAPGNQDAVLVGSNVTAPPAGKVYELWYIPTKDAAPVPAGTFQPNANGGVLMKTKVGSEFVALAVSVEPPGGSPTPTQVILVKNV
jgi:hypothetical protein